MEHGMYTVEVVKSEQELIAVKDEWKKLLHEVPAHEFHQHPDNIHLLLTLVYSETCLRIFLIRKNGVLCCIAPFFLMQTRFKLSLGIINLWKLPIRQYKLYGTCLIFSQQAEHQACLDALASSLHDRQKEYDLIYMESLAYSSPLYTLKKPLSGFKVYPFSAKKNVVRGLRTCNDFSEYLSTFRKKKRYNLKRNVRILSDAVNNDYNMEKVSRPEQVEKFLVAVDYIYERCWQKNAYGSHQHSTAENIAYHQSIARLGWLRSYLLICSGKPAAYIIGYQYKGRYYYEYIGYDQNWSQLSPGTVLTYLMIEDLHRSDRPEILDFGYGENTYKQIFGNYSYEADNTGVVRKGSKMHVVMLVQLALSRLYISVSEILAKTGLDKKARKLLKRR